MKSKEQLITALYNGKSKEILKRLDLLMEQWKAMIPVPEESPKNLPVDENDVVMITYGDSIRKEGRPPLKVLKEFADSWLGEMISGIHILPFSPYSSDDGFSVIDYRKIDPALGDWEDMTGLGENFQLMFDLVLNHCSARSEWFKAFLKGEGKYKNYFHTVDPSTDLSAVFRPRALPLLTEFETWDGKKHVWTTFSTDQVDLNFANPDVFLEFVDIILFLYCPGSPDRPSGCDRIPLEGDRGPPACIMRKTHAMVQLFRAILKEAAPHVILLTETNVPHAENISYFGKGYNEAHMVYQFTLPPLTLEAFIRENASHLTEWAASLPEVNDDHTYFNFMSSHDGIGVLGAKGYLDEDEVKNVLKVVESRGGQISYKATPSGEIPYEMNINYRDAVCHPDLPVELKARQFVSSQAVMLCMAGVPGIYVHSLLGSGNWKEGVEESGIKRRINREKLDSDRLVAELEEEGSLRQLIYSGFKELLKIRRAHKAFSPVSPQYVLKLDPEVFALIRTAVDGSESVLCLQNSSRRRLNMVLDGRNCPVPLTDECECLTEGGSSIQAEAGSWTITLEPYEVLWARF